MLDGAYGGAVADVAGDDILLRRVKSQEFGCAMQNIAVGGAVKSIATDAVSLIVLGGYGVAVGVVRHRLMEGGVKDSDLGQVGQLLADSLYAE